MLKEIESIVNKDLIEKYSKRKYRINVKKILSEIKGILKINKEVVELCKENNKRIPDGTVYSIVLRLRELYLINCLISNKSYSKKDFLKICPEKSYLAYTRIKRNEKETNDVSPDEIKNLLNLSEKWLKELKE